MLKTNDLLLERLSDTLNEKSPFSDGFRDIFQVFNGVLREFRGKEILLIDKTARLVIWLCLVCLLFALVCSVIGFIANTPLGFILAPVLCFAIIYLGVRYLQKTE